MNQQKFSSFSFLQGLDISKNPQAISAASNLREAIHDSLGEK